MKSVTMFFSAVLAGIAFGSEQIPLPEHPRPDFQRAEWQNLNGSWDFRFDGQKEYNQKILVPFGWGSPLSGVRDDGDTGCYRRKVTVPAAWKGKRVFVVVGAADHDTDCAFDGIQLGRHSGGYTPFEFELTPYVKFGKSQTLEFKIWDPSSDVAHNGHYLYGKQGYGNVRGIWQTVYLEARADLYVERVAFVPVDECSSVVANIVLSAPAKRMTNCRFELDGKTFDFQVMPGQQFVAATLELEKPHYWTLDDPYLYDVKLTLGNDVVNTYFGFRTIGVGKNANGDSYVTLNGKPIYLQLCLDQSYHPEGWYTFPSDEFMKNEILISKRLALSGNRVHIKVEVPRKLYWADKLGLLIQADVPNAWGPVSEAMFEEHWRCFESMVKRDFNHPSIYQWTLFNETWGLFDNPNLSMGLAAGKKKRSYPEWAQRKVAECYLKAKFIDKTRLVEDQSPCHNDHVITDVNSWHAYRPGWKWDRTIAERCERATPGSRDNYIGGHVQGSEPMMNSECGNVWGYRGSTGDCDFTWDYHLMMDAFRRHLKCAGWLYTEHHDVTNEWNGYVRFDRTPKETGIEELFPGMSLKDLHADACLPLDSELCRRFAPGETYEVPVGISLTTDRYAGKTLSLDYQLHYHDANGVERWGDEVRVQNVGKAASWQYGKLANVKVALPSATACGTINFTLFADGHAIARNFTCFHVEGATVADAKPVRSVWSVGSTNVLGGLKYNGFGKGYFEYEFASEKGGTFLAEVSTKRLNAKDFAATDSRGGLDYMLGGGKTDRSRNPNSYPQTSVCKHSGKVRVYANGTLVATVDLPDDPADHRGILSWASQLRDGHLREAGSYGYLVKADIPASLVKDGKVTIRLEGDSGLAVYGSRFGRYPFGPKLVGAADYVSIVRNARGAVSAENRAWGDEVDVTWPVVGTLYAQLVEEGALTKTNDFSLVASEIERATGSNLVEAVTRRLLEPLGLSARWRGSRLMATPAAFEPFVRMLADGGLLPDGRRLVAMNAVKTLRRKQSPWSEVNFASYGFLSVDAGRILRFTAGDFVAEAEPETGAYRLWKGPENKRAAAWKRANPVRTAVFVGVGPMGQSSTELVRNVARSPELDFRLVDAEDIRNGALDGVDLLVMPGGNSGFILEDLGRTTGLAKILNFIRRGGSYIGICAGAVILLDNPLRPVNGSKSIPFSRIQACSSDEMTTLVLNEKGAKALGMTTEPFDCWYSGGPYMAPIDASAFPDMKIEGWATFTRNVSSDDGRGDLMKGTLAIVGGTYGKGRLAACSCHPEFHHSADKLLAGLFRFAAGREVSFPEPKVNKGAKKVAFYSWPVAGKPCAELLVELDADPDVELVTVERHEINRGELANFAALVIPDGSDWALSQDMFEPTTDEAIAKFAAAGGRVYAWGANRRHLPKGGIGCRSGYEVYSKMKETK